MDAKKMACGIAATIAALSVCACGIIQQLAQPAREVYVGDCFHTFQLFAWQDLDADGWRGPSEPVLEGVRFEVAGPVGELWGFPPLSNAEGRFKMEIWHPCSSTQPDDTYTITAQPPASFQPTTPASVTFMIRPGEALYAIVFGFIPVSE
jgi:hypothetical protein